jgi:elongation factor G
LIDTPGHVDFTVEVERSLRVLDGAVLVLDGIAGVQAQTLTVWRQAMKHGVPVIGFVNKMDRAGANMDVVAASIATKLQRTPISIQAPVSDGPDDTLIGMLDFVEMQMYTWDDEVSPDGAEFATVPLTIESHPDE